ncbi:hypothetical protein LMG28140_02348 [Paraburkholderia metrosideri]|jgi:hypothetical protein|uniref:Uncharacterized protein n=1 Tax=Paraburkholderia metrosideri TaxID=580937 RepID=A0ABN7HSD3_9BURK|nr:hypothetical protein LMG28140_02348 [Paraburkholderia metrosideri]
MKIVGSDQILNDSGPKHSDIGRYRSKPHEIVMKEAISLWNFTAVSCFILPSKFAEPPPLAVSSLYFRHVT